MPVLMWMSLGSSAPTQPPLSLQVWLVEDHFVLMSMPFPFLVYLEHAKTAAGTAN
jgi:hypothetical protein